MKWRIALSLAVFVLCLAAASWAAAPTAAAQAPAAPQAQNVQVAAFLAALGAPSPVPATLSACCSTEKTICTADCKRWICVRSFSCTDNADGSCTASCTCWVSSTCIPN